MEDKKQRVLCVKCYRSDKACLCSEVTVQKTVNRFVILMHPLEFRNQRTGSGRLSFLGLKNSEIIVGVDFTEDKRVNEIINNENAVLLYPGEDATNLSTEKLTSPTPLTIFLIDSTWPCAKKIMKLSRNLHTIPKICFKADLVSSFRIKQQPHKDCLATIEAIAALIDTLKKQDLELAEFNTDLLLKPFLKMVENQMACAVDPNQRGYRRKPYSEVSVRQDNRNRRNLFHENTRS